MNKELLMRKMVSLVYGDYDPDQSKEETDKNIEVLKEKLKTWKEHKEFREILGPLQPAFVFSSMLKVPEKEVKKIARECRLQLPKDPNLAEFDLKDLTEEKASSLLEVLENSPEPDEYLLAYLSHKEKKKPFEIVDLTRGDKIKGDIEAPQGTSANIRTMKFLQTLMSKCRNGEIKSMSIIALQNNEKAIMWLPKHFTDDDVYELYQPILVALQQAEPKETN